jgi:hypothetical protein
MTALSLGIVNATAIAKRESFSWRSLLGRFTRRRRTATLYHRCLALHIDAAAPRGALS